MWRLPIFAVQAIVAGSLAVTMLIGIPALGLKPSRRDWFGVALTSVGVGLVSMAAGEGAPAQLSTIFRWLLAGALVATLVLFAVTYRRGGMIIQGVIAGLGYGLSALFIRVVMIAMADGHAWYASPELYLAAVSGAVGVMKTSRPIAAADCTPRITAPTAMAMPSSRAMTSCVRR